MSKPAEILKQQQNPLVVRLAERTDEIEQAFRLRYEVFVEEEGNTNLITDTGLERDAYDEYCDHLIVEDLNAGRVVGTYRLLPGRRALQNGGFYSETEFDLTSFSGSKWNSLELGRSCVASDYRNGRAIQMLWEGIADYIRKEGYRYLIGCASLHSSGTQETNEVYSMLAKSGMITDRFGIRPLDTHRVQGLSLLPMDLNEKEMYRRLPPLLKGYCWLGAEIGGEPAYDPAFDTTDFFIVLEADKIAGKYKRRFLGKEA